MVQQRHRGALAHGHGFAVVAVKTGRGHRAVGYRNLPGANHLIAGSKTTHRTVADGDQEGFFRHRRQPQQPLGRFGQADVKVQGITRCLLALHDAVHFRRLTQQYRQRQINGGIAKMLVAQAQGFLGGCLPYHGKRCPLTRTNRFKQR